MDQLPDHPQLPPSTSALEPAILGAQNTVSNLTETKPPKKHRLLKWLLVVVIFCAVVIGVVLWWLFYYRHFNFGHKGGDLGVLKAGIFEGTMNHFAPTMEADDATVYINRQIFEGLVVFEDKTKISPNLVTGWTNPDNKTWVFTLKPGIKFHDGNTLSSKDVVYSFNELKKNSSFDYVTETIDTVQAEGSNEVRITTKTTDPILLNRLVDMFIVDSSANGKADPAYGTGPYTLKPGTIATSSHIELVSFNNYHGGHVHTKGVQVTVYNEDDQSAVTKAFILGKLNLVAFVPSSVVATAKSLHFHSGYLDDPIVYQLGFNVNKSGSPLQNLKVRQAIYKTIDVEALLKAIGRDESGVVANQLLSSFIPGYNSDITRPAHDIEGAKQLLKQAGYVNGANITLTIFNAAQDAGQEIARQLGAIGIRVKLDIRDNGSELETDLRAGKLESFYYAEGTSLLDGSDAFSKVAQGANYHTSAVDALQYEASNTLDETAHLNALKKTSQLIANDVAFVPLYTNHDQWIMDRAYIMPEDTLVSGLGVYLWKVHL